VRRLAVAGLAAAVAAVPASAQEGEPGTSTLAAFRGSVMGVAQDGRSVAWLQWSPDGCSFRIRGRTAKTIRSVKYASKCGPYFHDLVLAGNRATWGGDDEVICGKTYATVRTLADSRPRLVQKLPRNCLGFGPSLRGLASDGRSFYYNVFQTIQPPSAWQCGDLGGVCAWQLGRGHIVRIDGSRPIALRGLPPTVMFAVAAGRIVLVQPLRRSYTAGGWPRAARNGKVEIRDLASGRVEAAFRPEGIVRSVALSPTRVIVLVELNGLRTVEFYDVHTGRRVRALDAPLSLRRLAPDRNLVVYVVNDQIRVFDLVTGRSSVVAETKLNPVGLSIRNGRVVWGENRTKFARIVVAGIRNR
jgi:hypothetical protein